MSSDAAAALVATGARPTRIAFLVEGTRGDVQPYGQFALGLKNAGHHIRFFTHSNHETLIKGFGIEFSSCVYDIDEYLRTPKAMEAMMTGDFFKMMDLMNAEELRQYFRKDIVKYWTALEEFEPELLLTSPLADHVGLWYEFVKNVPVISVSLQPIYMGQNLLPMGFPTPPAWTGLTNQILKMMCGAMAKQFLDKQAMAEEALGKELGWALKNKNWFIKRKVDPDAFSDTPTIIATSSSFGFPAPNLPKSLTVVGYFTMPVESQEKRARSGSTNFSSSLDGHATLQEFVASGAPPVYIGWGSMVCKSSEHMTLLAVRALRDTKQRGIVLGGWAKCSLDKLSGAPDEEALRAYCKESVLFVQAAPHALLFPQCACIVHHGGAGTTAASVLAGIPMVITPLLMDQFDNAKLVTEKNVGVGTRTLVKVTSTELGAAIRKCLTNETVKAAATEMREVVSREDGVGRAIQVTEEFINKKLQTGEWIRSWERRKKEQKPTQPVSCFACCFA